MKRFLMFALILSIGTIMAVSSSEANVIKKESAVYLASSNIIYQAVVTEVDAIAKAAFIYDAVIPAGIKMPEMKPIYPALRADYDSFRGSYIALIMDRSPPKIRYL